MAIANDRTFPIKAKKLSLAASSPYFCRCQPIANLSNTQPPMKTASKAVPRAPTSGRRRVQLRRRERRANRKTAAAGSFGLRRG